MFAPSLVNLAVLMYFSVSSGHGIDFDFHAGRTTAPKVEDRVVLRESPLSEKCGLGLETVTRPDEEIVALRSSVSGLPSALALGDNIKKQTAEEFFAANRWKKVFEVVSDDEGGLHLVFRPVRQAVDCAVPLQGYRPVPQPLDWAFPLQDARDARVIYSNIWCGD